MHPQFGDGVVAGHGTVDGRRYSALARISPFSVDQWGNACKQDLQGVGDG